MTNDIAIRYCDEYLARNIADIDKEFLKKAKEALQQEPCDKCVYSTSEGCQYDDITETIPPFEDCISRQAVKDLMRSLTRWCVRSEDGRFDNVGLLYDDVMFGIDRLPSGSSSEKPRLIDPAYEKTLNKWIGAEVLDRIRNEMHATAEKHEDGVYYLRDEWIDEIIDKYAEGSDKE